MTNSLQTYVILLISAPVPRLPTPSEKKYRTVLSNNTVSEPMPQPCWYDKWLIALVKSKSIYNHASNSRTNTSSVVKVEPAEVYLSVVVPAYNEEERLPIMLDETVSFLQQEYGNAKKWEILVVSDGSTDRTVETALSYTMSNRLYGSIRTMELEMNRGKGGAVTHGMRHVRGKYVVFADADGASKFSDLAKMIRRSEKLETQDVQGRAVIVGSRAHLVGSEAVVKVLKSASFVLFPDY